MRLTDLPSPGIGPHSIALQREVVNAISRLQVVAPNYPLGKHPDATALSNFLAAAKVAVDAIKPA